jgi:hypothetical protein
MDRKRARVVEPSRKDYSDSARNDVHTVKVK